MPQPFLPSGSGWRSSPRPPRSRTRGGRGSQRPSRPSRSPRSGTGPPGSTGPPDRRRRGYDRHRRTDEGGSPMTEPAAITPVKVLYTAEATVTGGRQGHGRTSDGSLEVDLVTADDCTVTARVGLGTIGEGRFGLTVALDVTLPSIADHAVAEELVAGAHKRCPYSNAVRGNIEVAITVR